MRPSAVWGVVRLAIVLGAALAAGGRGEATGSPPQLAGSVSSLDALGREALAGLSAADTTRLEALRLTEREHNELVWPELPAADPEAGFPVDIAWRNIQLRDARARTRLVARYAGRSLELERVECVGTERAFESFAVRTDCWATFTADGEGPFRRQLFKDVLVWGGQHKIFRYYE